jgi:oxygen-dependent protoporphyrinogen oxidase
MTFPQGIETIVQTMASFLKPELSTNESITEIQQLSEKEWVLTSNKRTIKASHLVLATPAKEAGQLIQKIAPEATASLNQIPYTRLVVLHVGFKKAQIGNKASGFGYLVAPSEKSDILGCLWNSNLFQNRAPADSALFTIFMGGQSNPRIISATDLDLINRATEAIRPIMSLKGNPTFTRLTRYEKAIPQYTIGHQDRMATLDKVEEQRPGLYFAGNYRGGISVGDVIQSAKILSSRFL